MVILTILILRVLIIKKSSIIGNGYSNISISGFINGISAHALELDDGHRFAQIHPGSVVFPPAIAISEANNIDGKKFLEAVICGYEVAIFLGILANPQHRNQGFHTSGTVGTFAAGAVVAKLLDLDLEKNNKHSWTLWNSKFWSS
ncbi:MmgE/PrpD family protein [Methanobrevibacter arboriphilus]|uniref:MmgE/PrpD family protein n=1 Tax=Methanobrevibacter arboriphilus TaxID=39441 RepID=UPI0029822ADE|nr:MmgE/PrpD family protein [Methanobrevibacter arboriphilus]